jgi:hypothetical protein
MRARTLTPITTNRSINSLQRTKFQILYLQAKSLALMFTAINIRNPLRTQGTGGEGERTTGPLFTVHRSLIPIPDA